jgi:hypothetical protein
MNVKKQNDYDVLLQLISNTYTEGYVIIRKTTYNVILDTY